MSEIVLLSQNAGGANLGTIVQRITKEISRHGSTDVDTAKLAVISAMRHFRNHRFWFNEGTHTFDLVVNQQEYDYEDADTEGIPSDWLRPITAYLEQGGSRWLTLDELTIEEMRWATPTSTTTGIPSAFCYYNEKFYFTPIPSQADSVRFDYVVDLGTPTYSWDGTTLVFRQPNGADLLDSWSSRWFIDAEELIRARAKWDIYYNYLDDDQNALKMGGMDGLGGAIGIAYNALKHTDGARRHGQRRRAIRI